MYCAVYGKIFKRLIPWSIIMLMQVNWKFVYNLNTFANAFGNTYFLNMISTFDTT